MLDKWKALVGIVGMVCITVLEMTNMIYLKADGVAIAAVVGAIAALVGVVIGAKIPSVEERKE